MEITEFNKKVDTLENLSLMQRALLSDINYYNEKMGGYILLKQFITQKYKEIMDLEGIMKELNELIYMGYVTKRLQKQIRNGRYTTIIHLTVNEQFLFQDGISETNRKKLEAKLKMAVEMEAFEEAAGIHKLLQNIKDKTVS